MQDLNDDKLVTKRDKVRLRTWLGISDDELDEVFPDEADASVRESAQAPHRPPYPYSNPRAFANTASSSAPNTNALWRGMYVGPDSVVPHGCPGTAR